MTELSQDQFPRVQHLFAGLDDHLAIGAMLRGIVPARVFVDNAAAPQAALIWDRKTVFFLAGNPDDQEYLSNLKTVMAEEITPELQVKGLRRWIRATCTSDWQPHLSSIWGISDATPAQRRYYVYRDAAPPMTAPVPAGMTFESVDPSLLGRDDLTNGDDLRHEIAGTWGSVEAFAKHGFGYCLVEDRRVVNWCLSEYNHGGRCELGVETAPDRRRRGLAGQTTSACIAHALAQGIRAAWHSWGSNLPSVGLAESAGFELAGAYTVYLVGER